MSTPKLRLRAAAADDLELCFAWANDPGTRAGSFSPAGIERRDHAAWFARALAGERRLYIAELEGRAVGLFRLDASEDPAADAEVGITVAPDARGAGLAPSILEAGARLARTLGRPRLVARVRADNAASIKSFERAGFAVVGATECRGIEAIVCRRNCASD